ncbi:MAG: DUF4064 domain-containing protein [Sporolactobacillus sp.]
MKRKAETVLAIIAVIFNALTLFVGVRLVSLNVSDVKAVKGISTTELHNGVIAANGYGRLLLICSLLSLVLLVIAWFCRYRRVKLSGILFLLAGVFGLINIVSGLLAISAGIVELARKEKKYLDM